MSSSVNQSVYKRKEAELKKSEIDIQSQIAQIQNDLIREEETFEQLKNIFLSASRAKKQFLNSDTSKKKEVLNTLLSNITIENQKIAHLSFKQSYNIIAEVEDLSDFEQLRGEWDSNPRSRGNETTDFESVPFDHSGISPKKHSRFRAEGAGFEPAVQFDPHATFPR